MWIDIKYLPLEEGEYNCLVDNGGFGNLIEILNEYFDGKDWCHYRSHRQFIRYWKASEEDYKLINNMQENQYSEYLNNQAEHAKNFGGI